LGGDAARQVRVSPHLGRHQNQLFPLVQKCPSAPRRPPQMQVGKIGGEPLSEHPGALRQEQYPGIFRQFLVEKVRPQDLGVSVVDVHRNRPRLPPNLRIAIGHRRIEEFHGIAGGHPPRDRLTAIATNKQSILATKLPRNGHSCPRLHHLEVKLTRQVRIVEVLGVEVLVKPDWTPPAGTGVEGATGSPASSCLQPLFPYFSLT